ncbi:hypothetical protein GGH95_005504, partial [Coemansia sp. RSA 1836]
MAEEAMAEAVVWVGLELDPREITIGLRKSSAAARSFRAGLPHIARSATAMTPAPSKQQYAPLSSSRSALRKKVMFPGALTSEYTHDLRFASSVESIPTYQVMDTDGRVLDAANEPQMSRDEARLLYKNMLILN